MSDLAATNCGCGNDGGCGSILWLIVLLCLCIGNGGGFFGGATTRFLNFHFPINAMKDLTEGKTIFTICIITKNVNIAAGSSATIGIEAVEITVDGDFSIFDTGQSSIVGRLRKVIIATLLNFRKNNACKAKGDDPKKNRSEDNDVERSDALAFRL